jgi:hypothetical protein
VELSGDQLVSDVRRRRARERDETREAEADTDGDATHLDVLPSLVLVDGRRSAGAETPMSRAVTYCPGRHPPRRKLSGCAGHEH